MLRIHRDRISLLAALTAHWADQKLQLPQALWPVVGPIPRRPGSSAEFLGWPRHASLTQADSQHADHPSANTAQPLPSPSTIQRRPKLTRL